MRKVWMFFISMSLCSFLLVFSFAGSINELKGMKQKIEESRQSVIRQKQQQEAALKDSTAAKLKLIEQERRLIEQLKTLEFEKAENEAALQALIASLEAAVKNYEDSLELFKSRVRAMYMNSNKTQLDLLLDSRNLIELTGKIQLLNSIAERDTQIVQEFASAQKDLEFKRSTQETQIQELLRIIEAQEQTVKDVQRNKVLIDQKISEKSSLLDNLKKQEQDFLEESKKLEARIKQMQLSQNQYVGGRMLWPVPSSTRISSHYGVRVHPVLKYSRMHTGLDIAANQGANIVAANNGKVVIAGWEGGYGNAVMIDHGGGIVTLYGHCSVLLVRVGQQVKTGTVIAKVGSTGVSTGPHLHFEVRKNGSTVNPLPYLQS